MLFLFVLFAYSSAQVEPISWIPCSFSSETTTESDSLGYIERFLQRDHWQQTLEAFRKLHASSDQGVQMKTGKLECANVSVPASYSNDPAMNGTVHEDASAIKYLQVQVARYVRYNNGSASKLAVWHFGGGVDSFSVGGPGRNSVEAFGNLLPSLSDQYEADVYVMNLRGISGPDASSVNFWDAMTPKQLSEQASLISNTTRPLLPFFNTDDDCRDLKRVIDLSPKQDIVLVGHSYGTYFVHRFVQIFPNVAVRAILDSNCAGPKGTILDIALWANNYWFPSLIAKCSADEFCNRVFEKKANDTIWKALSDENKTCGTFKASQAFRFSSLWFFNQPNNFQIIFAVLRRFSRCSAEDQDALEKISAVLKWDDLAASWQNTIPPYPLRYNAATGYLMRGSEFARRPIPSDAQLANEMARGPFGSFSPSPTSSLYAARRTKSLPWNSPSPWANLWAKSNFTKFFLLSGEIDFQTPYFLTEDFANNVPNTQTFVVPGAGHTAGLGTECGQSVLQLWVTGSDNPPACAIPDLSFQVPQSLCDEYNFYDWYGPVGLSTLGIALIVSACLLVVAIISGFIGVRM